MRLNRWKAQWKYISNHQKPTCILKQTSVESRVTDTSVVLVDGETRFICMNNKDGKIHYQLRQSFLAQISHFLQTKITTSDSNFEAIFLL